MMLELPADYTRRRDPQHFDDTAGVVIWQAAVYERAWTVAEALDADDIIDLGCGNGAKLRPFADHWDVIGVDRPEVIDEHRRHDHWARWISFDLETGGDLHVDIDAALIICADVIEHLADPAALLTLLHKLLDMGALAIVLSTPDRDIWRGAGDLGPPANAAHAQEWTLNEFGRLLDAHGLHTDELELVRSNNIDDLDGTILAVLRGDRP